MKAMAKNNYYLERFNQHLLGRGLLITRPGVHGKAWDSHLWRISLIEEKAADTFALWLADDETDKSAKCVVSTHALLDLVQRGSHTNYSDDGKVLADLDLVYNYEAHIKKARKEDDEFSIEIVS